MCIQKFEPLYCRPLVIALQSTLCMVFSGTFKTLEYFSLHVNFESHEFTREHSIGIPDSSLWDRAFYV